MARRVLVDLEVLQVATEVAEAVQLEHMGGHSAEVAMVVVVMVAVVLVAGGIGGKIGGDGGASGKPSGVEGG